MRFTMHQTGTNDESGTRKRGRTGSGALWTIQGLLAVVFLGAGVSQLILPIEDLTRGVAYRNCSSGSSASVRCWAPWGSTQARLWCNRS